MKDLLGKWKSFLNESSLSRVHKFIYSTETAILTAFRNDPNDMSKCVDDALRGGEDLPPEVKGKGGRTGVQLRVNKQRNRDLKATLLSLNYGVTRVGGNYVEDFDTPQAVEVGEESYIVVNLPEASDFIDNIIMLGKKFCQDSVLIIPAGGEGAHLYGTNYSEFPGLGQTVQVGNIKLGEEAEFMTRVNNRPFTFTEGLETYRDLSRNERMAVKNIAKTILD